MEQTFFFNIGKYFIYEERKALVSLTDILD